MKLLRYYFNAIGKPERKRLSPASAPTTAFKTLEIYPRDNTFGSAIAFCPLLIITKDQIDELLGMFGRALAETGRYVEKQGY